MREFVHDPQMQRAIFHTTSGAAVPAVSRAEITEIDRIAVEESGPMLLQMMEHAGVALAQTAMEWLRATRGQRWASGRVAVLVGPGRNGAGGLCSARHLANRGIETLAVLSRPADELRGASVEQLRTLRESPVEVRVWADAFDLAEFDVVIDAIVGYALAGPPRGPVMALVRAANATPAPTLSLDLPSGVDADSGEAPGVCVEAAATVTLALPKLGLRREHAGDLWLADLGIPPGVYARAGIAFRPFLDFGSRLPLRYPGEDT